MVTRIDISESLSLHPRQMQALQTEATELLFGGATEGGKSHFVRIALISWCLSISNLQCVLIRKKIDDIRKNHLEGLTGFRAILEPLVRAKIVKITQDEIRFHNGSLIYFQHCQDERQFNSAQGVEKHVIVIDEATQISERLIRFFRGWCRLSKPMKEALPEHARDMFPRIIYTANPIGVSVPFFKRNFVKCRRSFEIEKVEGFMRQFIPSRAVDNPSVDLEAHAGRLEGIGDKALAKALDEGDWDAALGEFFPEWDESKHVIPDFNPPAHWFKFRTFDWGSAEPFAVLWWTISDGEEITALDGSTLWLPSGSLVCYREWYGCDPTSPEKGIRLSNPQIAAGIVERTPEKTSNITLTDSYPFADRGETAPTTNKKHTMADVFAEHGVPLTKANTSRIQGAGQMRDRLIGIEDIPLIYFVESCYYCRDYIPSLPRDPHNIELPAEHGEPTHVCFSADTLIKTKKGLKRIDTLSRKDKILGGDGVFRLAKDFGMTKRNAEVIRLKFSDESEVVCTPDHQFLTNKGWREAQQLQQDGLVCTVEPWKYGLFQKRNKNLTAEFTNYIQNANTLRAQGIDSIGLSGNFITELSRKAFTYITKTTIEQITALKIFAYFQQDTTHHSTWNPLRELHNLRKILKKQLQQLQSGIVLKRAWHGISNMHRIFQKDPIQGLKEYALNAKKSLMEFQILKTNFVMALASKDFTGKLNEKKDYALHVTPNLNARSMLDLDIAPPHVVQNINGKQVKCVAITRETPRDVYCVSEPISRSFTLANGLVVSNCDSVRYACTARPLQLKKPSDKDVAKKSRFTPAGIKSKLIPSRKNILK